jgi:hypothetical protein
VYPPAHPFLLDLCERLLTGVERDLPVPLDMGITNGELVVGAQFYGGAGTRTEQLAGLLHGRKLLRMVWSPGVGAGDVEGFAGVLGRDDLQAGQVCDALLAAGVHTIAVEPLTLERIHGAFWPGAADSPDPDAGGADRAREAWQWLLHEDTTPEQLTAALSEDDSWTPVGMDPAEAASLVGVLVRTERKLERALGGLTGERREQVLGRLVEVGRMVPVSALARTLTAAEAGGGLHGPAMAALGQSIDEGRLVDLLAVLVADQGKDTRRLVDVYRRFAPAGGSRDLLPVVQARLASSRGDPFSGEVWKTLEQFLFSLHEDPFMEEDYAQALEGMAEPDGAGPEGAEDLVEDPEPHLDRALLALACDDPRGSSQDLLVRRLERRGEELGPLPGVRLLAAVHAQLPELLDRHPHLAEAALGQVCRGLREVDAEGRREVTAFVCSRGSSLLEYLMRRLLEEGRIGVRRFLVDVLTALPPTTTPAVVSRMRSGPWYLTRNLALVLGGRGDPSAVPALRSLLNHDRAKVRRAALAALGLIRVPGATAAVEQFARDRSRPEGERAAARRALLGDRPRAEGDAP